VGGVVGKVDMSTDIPIFIDIETTGFHPVNDRVLSVSLIDYRQTFKYMYNPGYEFKIENSHIHGITDEMVKGMPEFKHDEERLLGMLKDRIVIAYNVSFDKSFFSNKLSNAKDLKCCMVEYKNLHGRRYKLSEACEREGIEVDRSKLHDSGYDVELCKL